jgi:hypothetical protein
MEAPGPKGRLLAESTGRKAAGRQPPRRKPRSPGTEPVLGPTQFRSGGTRFRLKDRPGAARRNGAENPRAGLFGARTGSSDRPCVQPTAPFGVRMAGPADPRLRLQDRRTSPESLLREGQTAGSKVPRLWPQRSKAAPRVSPPGEAEGRTGTPGLAPGPTVRAGSPFFGRGPRTNSRPRGFTPGPMGRARSPSFQGEVDGRTREPGVSPLDRQDAPAAPPPGEADGRTGGPRAAPLDRWDAQRPLLRERPTDGPEDQGFCSRLDGTRRKPLLSGEVDGRTGGPGVSPLDRWDAQRPLLRERWTDGLEARGLRPWIDGTRRKPLLRERRMDGPEDQGFRSRLDGTRRKPLLRRGGRTDRRPEGLAPGPMGRPEAPPSGEADGRTGGPRVRPRADGTRRKPLLRERRMDGPEDQGFRPGPTGRAGNISFGRCDRRDFESRGSAPGPTGRAKATPPGAAMDGPGAPGLLPQDQWDTPGPLLRERRGRILQAPGPRELSSLGSRPAQPPQGDFDSCQPVGRLVGSANRRRVERTSLAESLGPQGLRFLREGRSTSQWIRRPSS